MKTETKKKERRRRVEYEEGLVDFNGTLQVRKSGVVFEEVHEAEGFL